MAIVVRYFSTSGAGAADGTTWADRAALFTAGNWSSVITGFAFNGSDSLECRIGPGTYTCSQSLASELFTNAPTAANPLILHGCDSSGNRLVPSNPGWQSAQPVDWDSSLPVIATTTNIATSSLVHTSFRLLKLTASGRTGGSVIDNPALLLWVSMSVSSSNASASGVNAVVYDVQLIHCAIHMSGSAYNCCVMTPGASAHINSRYTGVAGSSGTRAGMLLYGAYGNSDLPQFLERCTIVGFGGVGVKAAGTANQTVRLNRCVIANNGGSGFEGDTTASQTRQISITNSIISGNGGYGVDGKSSRVFLSNNRLRDNTSGNITSLGNYPTDFDNYVTDSDDATDYADAASYDFRTAKENAALWNKGYGMDEPNTAAGGVDLPDVMMVGA